MDNQPLKELIKQLRKDLCQKEVENASLRADQIRLQGQKDEMVKKLSKDADFEKSQVKRLKDEIRRLTSRTSDHDGRSRSHKESTCVASSVAALESSFMGAAGSFRAPLHTVNQNLVENALNKESVRSQSASSLEKLDSENEPKSKYSSKEKYSNAMQILENVSWKGAGSGIMKEDALDLAKHRVLVLEKELAQRQKIEQQVRHERDTYYESGGKWKTAFKQLEYKVAKRGCPECKDIVSQTSNISKH